MKLNSSLDVAALAAAYAKFNRLHVPNILDADDARGLHDEIAGAGLWNFVIHDQRGNIDLDADGWRRLDPQSRQRAQEAVHEAANVGFAYMHYKLSVYDRYHRGGPLQPRLRELFEFLNGAAFIDFARRLTGCADIAFADAQLTAFGPGHFVTIHDDNLDGKNRRAAYVLNMTPEWREDWGGYLNFFDAAGHVVAGYKPAFNAINVFTVPARHSVGAISNFAKKPRLAVSGWLRAGADPLAGGR